MHMLNRILSVEYVMLISKIMLQMNISNNMISINQLIFKML